MVRRPFTTAALQTTMPSRSSTDVEEAELTRWLWTASPISALLPHALHVAPGSHVAFGVPTREVVPGADIPGDVDVLAASLEAPERATAIEFMRIEIAAGSFHTGLPGKLADLRRGVRQANALATLGFHRTYLLVAVVTDAREQAGGRSVPADPGVEVLQTIDEYPVLSQLAPGVGLAFVQTTQPPGEGTRLAEPPGVHLRREAIPADQPAALTASIRALLRGRAGESTG